MNSQLHKNIMRRIWYAYAIWQVKNQLTTKAFWQVMVFGASLVIFKQVVHVASVFSNILATPLGMVPDYVFRSILDAVKTGDLAKVVTLVLLISITISILKEVSPMFGLSRQRQVI